MNGATETPAIASHRSPRWERAWLALAFVFVAWFDFWTIRSTGDRWKPGGEQHDYYNLLIDGWLEGHLHMKVAVPEALLKLKDPYDPTLRPAGLGLHDASFYRGKYYLYFGAAPVAVLMLPFRVLTGFDLPLPLAVGAFTFGGFWASVALWLAISWRYFPKAGAGVKTLGVLVLGFAGLGPVLLRRPDIWELPIGAGYCFAMATLGCVWQALHARRRGRWLFGAGLALGLAIASRPTYLLAMPLLLIPLAGWGRDERRWPWREAFAVGAPLAAIGALMAWHNYLRFDDPLQFGQAYQFSLDYESRVTHFSPRYLLFNAWRYFWSAAQWSRYFPFIAPAELPPKPPGFGGHDDVYGVLANLPFAWLALAAPLALRCRNVEERARLVRWLGAATLLFVTMAGVLLCFFGSLARYQLDFTPAAMLLACVGLLAAHRCAGKFSRKAARRMVMVAIGMAGAVSVLFAGLFSLQLDGLLPEKNPAQAHRTARALNRIPAAIERLRGIRHGAVELSLTLNPEQTGERTLLTIENIEPASRIFVRSVDRARVRFGFVQEGAPEILSRAVPYDFDRPHVLRATLGALFPPMAHPFFAGMSDDAISRARHEVRIELDGETLIDEWRTFSEKHPTLRAGAISEHNGVGKIAEMTTLRRVNGTVSPMRPAEGFARLRLVFPEHAPADREPIWAADAAGGGLIFVHYLGDARIAIGSLAGGRFGTESASWTLGLGKVHELTASWAHSGNGATAQVEVKLDGTIVWTGGLPWRRDSVVISGKNPRAEAGCAGAFSGEIFQTQIGRDGWDPLARGGDTLQLRLQLPRDRTGEREPLLVTGRTGAGDLVVIEYADGGSLRFGLDHWGAGPVWSEKIPIDYAKPHDVEVQISSLRRNQSERPGEIRVSLDGSEEWEHLSDLFPIEGEEFAVGRDIIGGTSCGPVFTGNVLSAERLPEK